MHLSVVDQPSSSDPSPTGSPISTGHGLAVGHQSRNLYTASAFALATAAARILPLGFLRALFNFAGLLYARSHPAAVGVVLCNLRLLDENISPATARRVYGQFGQTLADYFHIGTRPRSTAVRIISKITGQEHLEAAHCAGKGALIVTAHLGLFELGGLLMAESGFPSAALTFPEPSADLTQWRSDFRKRWGVDTIEIGSDSFAFVEIGRRLKEGCFVATLIDRPHPRQNIPVRLPHGAAGFSTGILLLAAHCGAPIIPATMVREADGFYRAQVFPPLLLENGPDRAETLARASQLLADILLPVLRAHPEQWYQFVPLSPAQ